MAAVWTSTMQRTAIALILSMWPSLRTSPRTCYFGGYGSMLLYE
ncbi:MAG: hypothetical protein QF843_04960 [Candidatus Thalassarchaeaceae archaeon]|nr:hypothetical protein [Candidatus Thalassarchaeaceae archaeon]